MFCRIGDSVTRKISEDARMRSKGLNGTARLCCRRFPDSVSAEQLDQTADRLAVHANHGVALTAPLTATGIARSDSWNTAIALTPSLHGVNEQRLFAHNVL